MMKKVFLSAVALVMLVSVHAQFSYDYLKAADNYYKKGDYYSAAQYYEKYLGVDKKKGDEGFKPYTVAQSTSKSTKGLSSEEQAVYNLAESYRQLNFHSKAEPYYRAALSFAQAQYPLTRFHLATTLRALEKYEEAEQEFKTFLDGYKQEDIYSAAAKREIQNLQFIRSELKKDIKLYSLTKAGKELNDTGATYAPVWVNTNTLVFTSTKPEVEGADKKTYTNRLYRAAYDGNAFTSVQKAGVSQDKDVHQGVSSTTADGNTMYLTRWTIGNGKKSSAIYISKKSNGSWSDPVKLSDVLNVPNSNTQQPYVMPGGKQLLFASDKAGGNGGYDLYVAELDASGNPVSVSNLTGINTTYDEQAPYYHEASGTLVFSSNGRVGMGGYDFFYSKGKVGQFAEPKNFGYPVNSVKDDIYFTSRGTAKNILEDVFLSSDRFAACCLEMFYLKKVRPLKQLNGVVLACENSTPLAGVKINVVDTINNKTVYTKTTGADGTYSFTLEDFQPLKTVAVLEGYHPAAIHFTGPSDEETIQLAIPSICLEKIPVIGDVVVLENVYFEFNKSYLLDESFASLDRLVELMNKNPAMEIEISGHTDNIGKDAYNQKLSEARAKSVVDYLVSKGIDANRLQWKGYGATMPIAPNKNDDGSDNPEGRAKNRRTEFKVLKN